MKQTKEKRKLPLRSYLMIGFLLFSVLLISVLWIFQTVFLEAFYRTVKTSQVKSCVSSVIENLDADNLTDLISDIEEQNNMSVGIFNTDEKIFTTIYCSSSPSQRFNLEMSAVYEMYGNAAETGEYSSVTSSGLARRFGFREEDDPHDEEELRTGSTPDEFFARTQGGSGNGDNGNNKGNADNKGKQNDQNGNFSRDLSLEREKVSSLAYARIVSTDSGERLVIVESEITPVSSVVSTLRYQLIIMTAVLAVLSVIVAILLSNMIAKPISDTNEKAKALARRKYDLSFRGGRYREITELNKTLTYAADELRKVDNLQKELIANISHDLRTPLTMITGYSEVMRDLPGEVTPENIQIIIDEANRLNSLVSDLLDISRLQSGTADIRRSPFSLTNSILSIFSRYTKLIESNGLHIVFEHEGEAFVNGDELRMTQVLYNLINNAINYIGEDKTVIVRQTVADGRVRVDVIDHGDGIPQEKLEYIWDRYYRVDKEHRRAVIGTGLGLSIVKNILIAHDADFGVASKLGEGSDFYFSMPVIDVSTEEV